jgi:hypothetical protein
MEYLFVSLSLLVCLFIHFQWIPSLIYLSGLFFISQLNLPEKMKTRNTRLQKWIPDGNFEWKSGVRKTMYIFISIWLLGMIFSFSPVGVPLSQLLLLIIILSFYDNIEPYGMIIAYEKNSSAFLFYKLKNSLLPFFLLSLPLIALFVFFHSHIWYVSLIIFCLSIIILSYFILIKYAFFSFPGKLSSPYSFWSIIGVIGVCLPVFAPVLILLIIYFYSKAKTNLNAYLNAYN